MKTFFCIGVVGLLLANNTVVNGQRVNYFTLPPFTDVSKVPWHGSTYRFPDFQKGKISYSTGFEIDHEFDLNYNIYYERMYFISSTGDTLEITATREIKSVQIGDNTFFHDYNSGFYEVIVPLPVSLAFRNKFVLEEIEYNSGVKRDATFTEVRGQTTNYSRIYKKQFDYFFVDQRNELNRATKASILKLFPGHETEIQGYLLEHSVDFESREDLLALMTYCNQFIVDSGEEPKKSSEIVTAKLPAGKSIPSGRRSDSLYRFPGFKDAKITWLDKSSDYYPQKMNYNLFTGKMEVVGEKGDTTNFRKWQEAKILNLDGNVFYHDFEYGYLEILQQGSLALAEKNAFVPLANKEVLTDSGFMEQAAASAVANNVAVTKYDRLYELKRTYFFIYKNRAHEANKVFILKLFSRDKEEIIGYMDKNNTSLEDKQDLRELTTFCNRLLNNR